MTEPTPKQLKERERLVRQLEYAKHDAQNAPTASDVHLAHMEMAEIEKQIHEFDERE